MKLSMETMYFPEAKFHHKKQMMADWSETSKKASDFSFISMASSLAAVVTTLALKDEFFFVYIGCAALFLLGALCSKKWKYFGYVSVLVAELMCLVRFYLEAPQSKAVSGVAIAVAVLGLVPSYFAFRCIYNYTSIFKELEKEEGFPNFIANTADLYGEKIYLQDEEETILENVTEASYNPFNSEQDVKAEEVRRYQEARFDTFDENDEPMHMDIDVKGNLVSHEETEAKRKAKKEAAEEGGFFIGSYELVFAHGDLYGNDYDMKRIFMSKWRENVQEATNNFPMFALVLAVAAMASGFGTIMGIFNFATIIVFVIATNHMKMGRWYAPVTMLIAILYSLTLATSTISAFMLAAAYFVGFRMFTGLIRYVLNYKSYKILSTQNGFPTFIRTTADIYGDRLYIVEKREPVVKGNLQQKRVKVMNIGYDDKPKKDEGAWNAFDYMDEKAEEKRDENES